MKHKIYLNGRYVGCREKLPKNGAKRMKTLRDNFGKGRFTILSSSKSNGKTKKQYRINRK